MTWTDEARDIIQDLLQELPLPVRPGIEESANSLAEKRAAETSATRVSLETAVHAFIEATPSDLRERLKHTLSYKGIDPEDYEAAFSS
jgi:hypothetical protein